MIAVIKHDPAGQITGWMMGSDMPELRRRAESAMEKELAATFYRMEFIPARGKYEIAPGVVMLVD